MEFERGASGMIPRIFVLNNGVISTDELLVGTEE